MKISLLLIRIPALLTLMFFLNSQARAAGTEFDYPELMVSPLASERLTQEASKEDSRKWTNFLPIQVSALSTLVAGAAFTVKYPTDGNSGLFGIGVGAGWIAATTLLALSYHPYQSGLEDLKAYPAGSKKQNLVRERMAEETINAAGSLSKRLMWISIATNFSASMVMASRSQEGSFGLYAAIGSAALSFTPFLFRDSWQNVARSQREYKKKIYAPIASLGWRQNAPELQLSFFF